MNWYRYIALVTMIGTTYATVPSPELIQQFLKPVSFTRPGIQKFLTDVFCHTAYGTYCLPANFMHIADFLSHAQTMPLPQEYALSIFDLFHARLKETLWVNPYALEQLLEMLAVQCKPLCVSVTVDVHQAVKKTLYTALLSRFSDLKKDPEHFITTLTHEVVDVVEHARNMHVIALQTGATRFIESALDKLIWDPREQEECWNICKQLAHQLAVLHTIGLIPDETVLNHCYWSLIYRFCYFIETAGEQLSPQTYLTIKQDIAHNNIPFLVCEEQEACLTRKARRLSDALFAGELKARSAAAGMWVE